MSQATSPAGSSLLTAGRTSLAAAALGLGVLGLVVGDFALQWQPVPETMPGRRLLAYLTATVLAGLGLGLLSLRFRAASATGLSLAFFTWALALHGARVVAAPFDVLSWLAIGEILVLAAGALMLAVQYSSRAVVIERGLIAGRVLFGVSLLAFGASHFAYLQFTADMIPGWIPMHLFWAGLTGAGHIAAGIAILAGVLARPASVLFALMVSGFVLLLHVPGVIGDPASRQEWTMLAMAAAISAAAWCAAGAIAARQAADNRRQIPACA